jgi:polyisoprenoid-binding protein YceI
MDNSTQDQVVEARSAVDRYLIDPGISRFTVRAFATGLLSALGHNPTVGIRDFQGEVRLAPDSLDGAGLNLKIDPRSLAVQDQISDKDRREMERQMNEEVLETSRFPEINYDCSSVSGTIPGPVTLNGQLTLHGVIRNQPVEVRLNVMGNLLKGSGEFTIRQSDYNIRLVSAVGGTIRLKDELKLSFDMAARKQKQG